MVKVVIIDFIVIIALLDAKNSRFVLSFPFNS